MDEAIKIQLFIYQFGIDIASFQRSELKLLSEELKKFLDTGVDTDDLQPADEYFSAKAP